MSGDTAAITTRLCPQCNRHRPTNRFTSARTGRMVRQCSSCRTRYANWDKLSPAERLARIKRKPRTGTGYFVALSLASRNRKTGPMPVSTTDQKSCPTSCTFRDAGCYAEFGKVRMHWETVPKRGMIWGEFCLRIAMLPGGTVWRHNEAGDLPGVGNEVDRAALRQLVRANRGRRGFTFTHKPVGRGYARNRKPIRDANRGGFTINLSADSLPAADELAGLGIAPVVVVLPSDAPDRLQTPEGREVIVCLAESKGLTCLECRLCAVPSRKAIVGFRAHGQAKGIVSELVTLRLRKAG